MYKNHGLDGIKMYEMGDRSVTVVPRAREDNKLLGGAEPDQARAAVKAIGNRDRREPSSFSQLPQQFHSESTTNRFGDEVPICVDSHGNRYVRLEDLAKARSREMTFARLCTLMKFEDYIWRDCHHHQELLYPGTHSAFMHEGLETCSRDVQVEWYRLTTLNLERHEMRSRDVEVDSVRNDQSAVR
jgi:hypothetical protein